jgi:hypothetical protein
LSLAAGGSFIQLPSRRRTRVSVRGRSIQVGVKLKRLGEQTLVFNGATSGVRLVAARAAAGSTARAEIKAARRRSRAV